MKLLNEMELLITVSSLKYKKMSSYCLKCKKSNTENINPRLLKNSIGKTMLLSKCAIYGSKKARFIKKREESGILSSLSLKTPLSKIPLSGDIFFKCNTIELSRIK